MSTILGIWGEDKTCKSTLSLTFPKPIAHMELDIGGRDRAIRNDSRYGFKQAIQSGEILTKYKGKELSYSMQLPELSIDPVKGIIRSSKRVTGIKETWYRLLVDYIALLKAPVSEVATIDIDTATRLWELDHTAFLQELQESQLDAAGNLKPGANLRTNLTEIEYAEPNRRMRAIVDQAKIHGKNLILTHHARDEYGQVIKNGELTKGATGRRERSGWGRLGDSADMIVHTYLKDEPVLGEDGRPVYPARKVKIPYCQIDLCEILELVGVELREPTHDSIQTMIDMVRGE